MERIGIRAECPAGFEGSSVAKKKIPTIYVEKPE